MATWSVIIPTLGEATRLASLLVALKDQGFDDVIVADASPDTATYHIAIAGEARCLPRLQIGRGAQMHAAAQIATGEILFFLHADTILSVGTLEAIQKCMTNINVVAGCLRLAFDRDHPLLSLYAFCSRLNVAITTYGDQGLFVRRSIYETIGGFAQIALLEDLEIQARLRRAGRFVKLPLQIITSSRRFVRRGILRQQLLNIVIVIAYLAGVSPERLARWYNIRSNSSP